jgi:hypothetical protein
MRERRLPESLDATDPVPRAGDGPRPLENIDEIRRLDRFFSTTDMAKIAGQDGGNIAEAIGTSGVFRYYLSTNRW